MATASFPNPFSKTYLPLTEDCEQQEDSILDSYEIKFFETEGDMDSLRKKLIENLREKDPHLKWSLQSKRDDQFHGYKTNKRSLYNPNDLIYTTHWEFYKITIETKLQNNELEKIVNELKNNEKFKDFFRKYKIKKSEEEKI